MGKGYKKVAVGAHVAVEIAAENQVDFRVQWHINRPFGNTDKRLYFYLGIEYLSLVNAHAEKESSHVQRAARGRGLCVCWAHVACHLAAAGEVAPR